MNDLFDSAAARKKPAKRKADSYSAKDIEVLEGLEPVRRRPGMYIGGTDERAMHHLAAEIIDNSMDEAVAGEASHIDFTLAADNGEAEPSEAVVPAGLARRHHNWPAARHSFGRRLRYSRSVFCVFLAPTRSTRNRRWRPRV